MKLLILGIDGLGEESMRGMRLNRLAALIENGQRANPLPDNIVSRGWPEIYSGVTAYDSGAFFQIPVMSKGRIKPTQKTGADVVANHLGADSLLWSRLHALGYRVGLYGLPTVTQPQDGCEFSFPATGAGQFRLTASNTPIFPKSLAKLGNYTQQNLGFRIGRGAFLPKDCHELEGWLRDHISQYFSTLRWSLNKIDVDALIAGSRFVTLFYKFRHVLTADLTDPVDIELRNMLLSVAEDFDYELARFIQDVAPRDLFVVSDHGLGELRYQVNINELLKRNGYIQGKSLPYRGARFLAFTLRDKLRGSTNVYYPSYDLDKSKAFSISYTDVIYINDSRFTGNEMSDEQRYQQACKLADKLSNYVVEEEFAQFVEFKPLRNTGWTSPKKEGTPPIPLPDIRCVLAEGCINMQRTHGQVVEKNRPYFARDMYEKGFVAEHSGCKSSDAIAAYVGTNKESFAPKLLTELYGQILRVAENV